MIKTFLWRCRITRDKFTRETRFLTISALVLMRDIRWSSISVLVFSMPVRFIDMQPTIDGGYNVHRTIWSFPLVARARSPCPSSFSFRSFEGCVSQILETCACAESKSPANLFHQPRRDTSSFHRGQFEGREGGIIAMKKKKFDWRIKLKIKYLMEKFQIYIRANEMHERDIVQLNDARHLDN